MDFELLPAYALGYPAWKMAKNRNHCILSSWCLPAYTPIIIHYLLKIWNGLRLFSFVILPAACRRAEAVSVLLWLFALLSYKFPVLHCKDDIIATVYFFKCAETENWHWRKGFFCVYGYRQIGGVFFKLRQRSFYLFAGGDNILIGK